MINSGNAYVRSVRLSTKLVHGTYGRKMNNKRVRLFSPASGQMTKYSNKHIPRVGGIIVYNFIITRIQSSMLGLSMGHQSLSARCMSRLTNKVTLNWPEKKPLVKFLVHQFWRPRDTIWVVLKRFYIHTKNITKRLFPGCWTRFAR